MASILKTLFESDITRYIETVIKADDNEHLLDEMNEYVLTAEVAGQIGDLFTHYSETGAGGSKSDGPNGVWVSGFFGCGKSHLLKMLSYALENREINGVKLGQQFLKKVKEQHDPQLSADVEKSLRIPSESILFNIDQKADALGNDASNADALIGVFYKVFNEHCGYSTSHFLAGIERHLTKSGKYEAFKKAYRELHGSSWEESRSGLHLIAHEFAEAYANVSNLPHDRALELFDKYDTQFKLSIEDFANDVYAYIETKPAGFRLNFFVDEVGQYIGSNSRLMLNLQTIVETLATKTRKNAWVYVTSQSDLNTAIGDVTGQQQQDFSKINARFAIKIPLTSRNAEEVIRKRLLQKNADGIAYFSSLYKKEQNNLGTIFHFQEGLRYRQFSDEAQFIHLSPFIPYQSELFQQCIKGLSEHNAFQGKHQSFGERSMLGVYQFAAKTLAEKPAGTWATFDTFYDGMRGTLRPETVQLVTVAENNLDSDMAKKLLKTLFLVKYTATFKATAQNLAILMIHALNTDLEAHEKAVIEALNILESQAYVRRTNDGFYEFLTSEEKDIQTEINQTTVTTSEVTRWIADVIFKDVIGGTRITCQLNGQPYEYCRRIDDVLDGPEKILGINLITRYHEFYDNQSRLIASNMGSKDLLIRLDNNPVDLTKEITSYLKTERYVKQQHNPSETRKLILDGIRLQNNDRDKLLRSKLETLLSSSPIFHNGSIVNTSASNSKLRIQEAFQRLIGTVYTNLRMLPSSAYTDEQVKKLLLLPQDDVFLTVLNPAEEEVLTRIKRKDGEGLRISIADCIKDFQLPPYGWYIAATLYQIASLVLKERVEISLDTERLSTKELAQYILNSQKQTSLLIILKETYSEKDLTALAQCYLQLFDENMQAHTPAEYAEQFRRRLNAEVQLLTSLQAEFSTLPAAHGIAGTLAFYTKFLQREEAFFLKEIAKRESEFRQHRDQSRAIVKILQNASQKAILERARRISDRQRNPNYDFQPSEESSKLLTLVNATTIASIPEIKSLCDEIERHVGEYLKSERVLTQRAVKEVTSYFETDPAFKTLTAEEKEKAKQPLVAIEQDLYSETVIANVIVKQDAIKRVYGTISEKISDIISAKTPSPAAAGKNPKPAPAVQPQIVSSTTIAVSKNVSVIETEAELDIYLNALRTAWAEVIRQGKRISI